MNIPLACVVAISVLLCSVQANPIAQFESPVASNGKSDFILLSYFDKYT